MRVLVGCESSGTVRNAFRALGHKAYSCDILPSDNFSQYHFQMDVMDAIKLRDDWDLIILHPPCTALPVSGNAWYGKDQPKHQERIDSVKWTGELWELAKRHSKAVAMENPVGILGSMAGLKPNQYIQPYQFGHMEQKKTGLWLYNLPELVETDNVREAMMELPIKERQRIHYLPPSTDRWKIRSKTFNGIAAAMAQQWGS